MAPLPDGRLQLGKLTLDRKTRAISLPATLNMREGIQEYLLATEKGKLHECLLFTEISPLNLNVALKLLRYQESPELFEILDEQEYPTGKFHQVPEDQKAAARLSLTLQWEKDGKTVSYPLNRLLYHSVLEKPMPADEPWLYTGSYLLNGKFAAAHYGDIIAIHTNQPSLINFPGKDRLNDEVWIPHQKLLPPLGTPLTLIITPFNNSKP